jgi:RND family efflux transporter MFP subunit
MTLLRKPTFYIAIIGILLAVYLIMRLNVKQPPPVPFVEPAANPFANTIAASGIIEAVDRNISIGVPASGLINRIYVSVGDHVQKGELLFTLDDRDLQARLGLQKAEIGVSKASLVRLKDQLGRYENVRDQRAVSKDEVNTKRNDVAVAEAQLNATEAAAKETERLIDRLKITAPRAGTILQNNVRVGEYISTTSTVPAMVLGNLDRLQVRADVDEQNAISIIPGAEAVAFPRNNTTLEVPLTFSYIEPYVIPKKSLTGANSERVDTRVLQVIYTFEQPEHFHLFVGQLVDVFIKLPNEEKH